MRWEKEEDRFCHDHANLKVAGLILNTFETSSPLAFNILFATDLPIFETSTFVCLFVCSGGGDLHKDN